MDGNGADGAVDGAVDDVGPVVVGGLDDRPPVLDPLAPAGAGAAVCPPEPSAGAVVPPMGDDLPDAPDRPVEPDRPPVGAPLPASGPGQDVFGTHGSVGGYGATDAGTAATDGATDGHAPAGEQPAVGG